MKTSFWGFLAVLCLTAGACGIGYYAIKQTAKYNPEMVGQVSTVVVDAVVGKLPVALINNQ